MLGYIMFCKISEGAENEEQSSVLSSAPTLVNYHPVQTAGVEKTKGFVHNGKQKTFKGKFSKNLISSLKHVRTDDGEV